MATRITSLTELKLALQPGAIVTEIQGRSSDPRIGIPRTVINADDEEIRMDHIRADGLHEYSRLDWPKDYEVTFTADGFTSLGRTFRIDKTAAEADAPKDAAKAAGGGWKHTPRGTASGRSVVNEMPTIDLMSGVEFEDYVAARLRLDGWDVSSTSMTGDYGVDLIAKKDGRWFAVQCKRYGKPVGISAVQQAVSGAAHYECKASMVVSNQEFTQAAKMLASTHNCVLVGRSKLATTQDEPLL